MASDGVTASPAWNTVCRCECRHSHRTPLESWIAVDDLNPDTVYVAYTAKPANNGEVFVARSSDAGATWGTPVMVNDDTTSKHQFWPAIAVSNGVVHAVWYDFRESGSPGDPASGNSALDVFYAHSLAGSALSFGANVRVTDVSHDPNCLMFGGGTSGFHGDYIELAARYDAAMAKHIVHVAWAHNRDVSPCDLDPAPGPPSGNTGNRNQNIYADTLVVSAP